VLVVIRVTGFALDPRDGRAVVLFHADDGRCLPLWVDDADAHAVANALRGDRTTTSSAAAFVWASVQACGGGVDRCELVRESGGVMRAVVIVEGAFGPAEIPARASLGAAIAVLAGAPIVVDEATLAAVDVRLGEAAARVAARAGVDDDDVPLSQSTGERWNQLLQHFAQRLVDDRPS
jgi:bifunctional DNase/RNase